MNEIQVVEPRALVEAIDAKKIKEYLEVFGLANDMTEQEVKQFTEIAQAFQLNPFKREIYCVAYGKGEKRRLSIITGYETYLKRAERLGTLSGWRAWTEGDFKIESVTKTLTGMNGGTYEKTFRVPRGSLKAIIEINRKDWEQPFIHEVYLEEYAQENEMWADKPRTMLKKVAIAQAFRMAFPDELGGMPYSSEELPDHRDQEPINVTPKQESPQRVDRQEEKKEEENQTGQAAVFNGLIKEIAALLIGKSEGGYPWFDEKERADYRETAKGIGSISNKDAKIKAMKDLLHKIEEDLKARKERAYQEAAENIDEAYNQEQDPGQDLF